MAIQPNIVRYHIGPQNQYSLTYVATDLSSLHDFVTDQNTPPIVQRYCLNSEVFCCYTNSSTSSETSYFIPDNTEDAVFAQTILAMCSSIATNTQNSHAYKQFDIQRTLNAVNKHVDWGNSVPEVAAQLLSALILSHGLPNSNHRTSIGIICLLLSSVTDEPIDMNIFKDNQWVDEFIVSSKEILTVRRNSHLFRFLQDHGCDIVMRKGDVPISLSKHPQLGENLLTEYAQKHVGISEQFITRLCNTWKHSDFRNTHITYDEFTKSISQV